MKILTSIANAVFVMVWGNHKTVNSEHVYNIYMNNWLVSGISVVN